MNKSVIFIDFENIQQINVKLIDPKTKIIVIVGLNQDNKSFEFAKNIFNSISSIELIKVNGRGKNALDIFIAFYIGKYFDSIKESEIIIYSNDSDYDQLIKHLDGYGITIKKIKTSDEIKNQRIEKNGKNEKKQKIVEKKEIAEPKNDNIEKIIDYLQKQTKSQKSKRPKKMATLENYLFTHFAHKISLDNIKKAVKIMETSKRIIIKENKINYQNI